MTKKTANIKTVYFHFNLPKDNSTLLQLSLARYLKVFNENGILYPVIYDDNKQRIQHDFLISSLTKTRQYHPINKLKQALAGGSKNKTFRNVYDQFKSQLINFKGDRLFISSNLFSLTAKKQLAIMKSLIEDICGRGVDFHLLVSVKSPQDWINGRIMQEVISGWPLEKAIKRQTSINFNSKRLLKYLEENFLKENIHYIKYENSDPGICMTCRSILKKTGIIPEKQPEPEGIANRLSTEALLLISEINKSFSGVKENPLKPLNNYEKKILREIPGKEYHLPQKEATLLMQKFNKEYSTIYGYFRIPVDTIHVKTKRPDNDFLWEKKSINYIKEKLFFVNDSLRLRLIDILKEVFNIDLNEFNQEVKAFKKIAEIRNVFLHIGLHKTGSTSIQKKLNQYRDILIDKGYLYPKFVVNSNEIHNHSDVLASLSTTKILKNKKILHKWGIKGTELQRKNHYLLMQLVSQMNTYTADKLILSGEGYSLASTDEITKLKEIFDSLFINVPEYKCIAFIRDPVRRAISIANQRIKDGLHQEYVFSILKNTGSFDFRTRLTPFLNTYGKNNCIIIKVEDAIKANMNLSRFFMNTIGQDMAGLSIKTYRQNTSTSHEACLLLSEIYKKINPESNAINGRIARQRLNHIIEKMPGQKYSIPQKLQEEIYECSRDDMQWLQETYSIDPYEYTYTPMPEASSLWGEETLNYLRMFFPAFDPEIRKIMKGILSNKFGLKNTIP